MEFNYQQICSDLIKNLNPRVKDVVSRRFGLKTGNMETLQAIGDSYKITRERVRQIEADGFSKLRPLAKEYEDVFEYFSNRLKEWGDLKREDKLLFELGGEKAKNQVLFLLSLGENFEKVPENEELYTLWTVKRDTLALAQNFLNTLISKFNKIKTPLSCEEILNIFQKEKDFSAGKNLNEKSLLSYLEISKAISCGPTGLWGLFEWPEINPRGVKDKAYIVFKNQKKPLHFRDVTDLINQLQGGAVSTLSQTVHNELIRDPRFILVGRGIYALEEWGYKPGVVKDVITKVLKENKKPLNRKEIVELVLNQRLVKESTVLANLQDRETFIRDDEGKYRIRKA